MRGSRAFYDTNVLIAYLFRERGRAEIARRVLREYIVKAMSIISIHEIHVYSIRYNVEDRFIEIKELLHKLFKVEPITQDVCMKASHIRIKYGLPEVDALILATAINGGYKHFFTFDRDFKKLDNDTIENTIIHYLNT
ncbi:MAG: PIN domain-containing protein [Desulfurococcales archaeon]|nr:PIN domain-containing protein [Desulfurococcales archaeon]